MELATPGFRPTISSSLAESLITSAPTPNVVSGRFPLRLASVGDGRDRGGRGMRTQLEVLCFGCGMRGVEASSSPWVKGGIETAQLMYTYRLRLIRVYRVRL